MTGYLLRRALHAVLILIGVSLVTFMLMHLTGDPVTLFVPLDASPEDVAIMRTAMGFDRPLHTQYLDFLGGLVRGDFGDSLRHRQPALELVVERLPATLQLTFLALGFAVLAAIPLGVVAASKRGSGFSLLTYLMGLLGQSMPVFWLGLVLILFFSVNLRLLPASGRGSLAHLLMPALTIGTYSMAMLMRLMRATMMEILSQDFIRTARAKGLSERVVVFKHAMRNALIPVVTVMGLQLGTLLGGAVITETVFSWPGLGRLLIQGFNNRDMAVVQAAVFVMALMIVGANLITDLAYGVLDPRVRYG